MKQVVILALLALLGASTPTGAYAQVCGDSSVDLGEACDDGNVAPMDGCSASCSVETGWDCSCSAPSFSYSMEMNAGRIGGPDGSAGPQMGCGGNDVLIGLAIGWSDARGEGVRTRALCGAVSVDAEGVVTTTPTTTEESGGSGCFGWDPSTWSPDVTCPTGWAVVGLTGSLPVGGTTLFTDLNLVCQQMGVDGNPAGSTMTVNIPGGGGTAGVAQAVSCPSDTIARFFQTRSGCGQDALDLFCGVPTVSCSGSGSICATRCGDGVIGAPMEQCDDGNAVAGDGCDASCQSESGWTCSAAGAACAEVCGDSIVVGAEVCDEGAETATCDGDCTSAVCGDGRLNTLAGEGCDEGMSNSDTMADACRTTCVVASCGDSIVDTGEECDDGEGNADVANSCRTSCVVPVCGDGIVDTGEACDDGAAGSATCDSSCADIPPEMDAGAADAGAADAGVEGGTGGFGLSGGAGCSAAGGGGSLPWMLMLPLGFLVWRRRRG